MNNYLSKELKAYVDGAQKDLVALLDTLCRVPAPSNHEERRAEFIKNWYEKEGC